VNRWQVWPAEREELHEGASRRTHRTLFLAVLDDPEGDASPGWSDVGNDVTIVKRGLIKGGQLLAAKDLFQ
jgi:hypothetical protein